MSAIEHTLKWLDEVIIGQNFCPFAKQPRSMDTIRCNVSTNSKAKSILQDILDECVYLDSHAETETSLVIIEQGLRDFYDYLDVLDVANTMLEQEGYEGIYQIASFHPDYVFEGDDPQDPSHCTNRSPYPIFHLLREQSLSEALAQFPHPEKIPERNIEHARKLGLEFFSRYR